MPSLVPGTLGLQNRGGRQSKADFNAAVLGAAVARFIWVQPLPDPSYARPVLSNLDRLDDKG